MARRVRLALIGAVVLGIAAFAAAYGYLVLSTANAPTGARLSSSTPGGSATGNASPGSSSAGGTGTQYTGADGPWVLPETDAGFVGYRAREILAIDFFRAPNDAVGRTTDVTGTLQVTGTQLIAAEITANVEHLRSDEEPRDMHVVEYLDLRAHPDARFRLTKPVEIGPPQQGRVVEIKAPGQLTIRDATRDVVWPLQTRWNGDSVEVAGQLEIRRSDYGMDVGQLLGFRVAEEITIELQLRFTRPCEQPCVAGSPGATGSPGGTGSRGPTPKPIGPGSSPTPSAQPAQASRTSRTVPGGGQLAFMGLKSNGESSPPDTEIYVFTGKGAPKGVTQGGYDENEPAWSADGRFIAYIRASENAPPRIHIVKADGTGDRELASDRDLLSPDWSVDGRTLVCVPAIEGVAALITVDVRSGKATTIREEPGAAIDTPDWSPDGRRIAFGRFPKGSSNQDIWLINRDGSGLKRLTRDPGYEYSPDWSPDGRRITFVREGDVWVIGADGRGARRLTKGLKADSPAWSPDARRIAFTQENDLWVMNADGTDTTAVELPFDVVTHPVWRPR